MLLFKKILKNLWNDKVFPLKATQLVALILPLKQDNLMVF